MKVLATKLAEEYRTHGGITHIPRVFTVPLGVRPMILDTHNTRNTLKVPNHRLSHCTVQAVPWRTRNVLATNAPENTALTENLVTSLEFL